MFSFIFIHYNMNREPRSASNLQPDQPLHNFEELKHTSLMIVFCSQQQCVFLQRRYHSRTQVFISFIPTLNHSCGTTSFAPAPQTVSKLDRFQHHSLFTFACASMPCSLTFTPSHSFYNPLKPFLKDAIFMLKSSSLVFPTTLLFKPPSSTCILPAKTPPSPANCSMKLLIRTYPLGNPSSTQMPKPA